MMQKIIAIINPISGTSSKKRILTLLGQYFPADEFERQFILTEYQGHASKIARQAVKDKTDYVIAVGGDGTVNEVAKALVHSSSVLGIVPTGSGNGLARDLSIPLDLRKALDVIKGRHVTAIDYCKANNEIFFCTCGVGFDARVSKRFAGEKRRGAWAYMKSIITELRNFKPDTYEIAFENEILKRKAFLVTCANASQYGNNAFIAPQANINDGMMDVAILSPISFWDYLPLIIQMFTKQMTKNNKIQYYKSKKLTLKRKKPGIMHIDGEPIRTGKAITIEVVHDGLNVIVPPHPVHRSAPFFSFSKDSKGIT
jgi:YegS/Rv2252/BmrU family lipid kinase